MSGKPDIPKAGSGLLPETEHFLFNQYKAAVDGRLMPQDKDAAQFFCFMLGFAAAKTEAMKILAAAKATPSSSSNE